MFLRRSIDLIQDERTPFDLQTMLHGGDLLEPDGCSITIRTGVIKVDDKLHGGYLHIAAMMGDFPSTTLRGGVFAHPTLAESLTILLAPSRTHRNSGMFVRRYRLS